MLLGSAKLRVVLCKGVLEIDRLQLTVLANPNVLEQRTESIGQAHGRFVVLRGPVPDHLPGFVALGEELDDRRCGEKTLKTGVHVAGVGKVGHAAQPSHCRLRLDVFLQLWIVAATLRDSRLKELKQAKV